MRLLSLLLVVLLLASPAHADKPGTDKGRVRCESFRVAGTAITSLAKAAGGSATVTDWLPVGEAEQFSIGTTITCTQTVSVVFTILCADENKVSHTPNPSITITRTASATPRMDPLSLPVCNYVAISIAPDATYPVTVTECALNRW